MDGFIFCLFENKSVPFFEKPNIRHNAAPSLPTEDEPLIWQTWVPLTKEAQNIEVQIWYPTETLATGEGDRGYRYQLELSEEGVKDQKDTRISALDKSSLVVQQLGGRENAAVLPIHE
ncbi:hypothetical protein [Pseudomonas frederiksbergensis]|uniref:hypothetical protein n=1 Tax=Pseudomonas frederiksbergensis TaxID=104087 RepID=UPI003D231506